MMYVAFAHDEGGRLSGEWAVEHLGGDGQGRRHPGCARRRQRPAPRRLPRRRRGSIADIEVIIGPYTDFDRTKAFDAAQNLLTAHDDIDLIYGVSTTIGLGAAQAVKQAGKTDEIATMGFGGTGDEIVAMDEGWLTASVLRSIDDSGVAVADAFVAHSKGEEVPQVWSGPFVMIDKDSDADALVAEANRYSKPKMGR